MTIHSCSYYCNRPECIKAQRDEFVKRMETDENGCERMRPADEPVAWADMDVRGEDRGLSWTPGQFHTQPLYTRPQPADELVAHHHEWFRTGAMEHGEARCIKCGEWKKTEPQSVSVAIDPKMQVILHRALMRSGKVITQPQPTREWVGLTEEQISAIAKKLFGFAYDAGADRPFARAIEAKLKEKNT